MKIINPSAALVRAALLEPEWVQTCNSRTCSHASHDPGYYEAELPAGFALEIVEAGSSVHGWGVTRLAAERALLRSNRADRGPGGPFGLVRKGSGGNAHWRDWDSYPSLEEARAAARRAAISCYDWGMAPEAWEVIEVASGRILHTEPNWSADQILAEIVK